MNEVLLECLPNIDTTDNACESPAYQLVIPKYDVIVIYEHTSQSYYVQGASTRALQLISNVIVLKLDTEVETFFQLIDAHDWCILNL